MADKILRRTSYGGEQTENLSKDSIILVILFEFLSFFFKFFVLIKQNQIYFSTNYSNQPTY